MIEMDWEKNGTKNKAAKKRRIAIPMTEELERAILVFKKVHPDVKTDTAVLETVIEAGFRVWGAEQKAKHDGS